MINLQRAEKTKNAGQLPQGILTFASPAITPSNTFKSGLSQQHQLLQQQQHQRDSLGVNSSGSQIHGRKCDSPQLRVMREDPATATVGPLYSISQRPHTAATSTTAAAASQPVMLRKDDYLQLYNYQAQIRELNHTNKEIKKKQFDFALASSQPHHPAKKANVTISYDSNSHDMGAHGVNPHHQHRHSQLNYSSNLNDQPNSNARMHKTSKSIGATQKKRQQSQSATRHPANQAYSNVNQSPLINLQIQNSQAPKIANQLKPQINPAAFGNTVGTNPNGGSHSAASKTQSHKRQNAMPVGSAVGVMSNSQIPQKSSAPLKPRSKSKNRQKSQQGHINTNVASYNSQLPMGTQQRANFMAQATKEILNKSSNYKPNKNSFLFSFDNKENSQSQNAQQQLLNHNDNSISYHEFSPARIISKQPGQHRVNNFLDSDSSGGEEDSKAMEQQLAQKLEKQYFLDKSTLLKHLSPDRNKLGSKTRHAKNSDSSLSGFAGGVGTFHHYNKSSAPNNIGGLLNSSGVGHQVLSDRDSKSFNGNGANAFSNASTIMQGSNLNESAINKSANQSLVNIKFKKLLGQSNGSYLGGHPANRVLLKGVDRLIKENLRKNKSKEEEEISKRHLEEFKQKLRRNELSQRNQQVRKINASRIMGNAHILKQSVSRVKKQRSKSCMNKTDSIFGAAAQQQQHLPRSRERHPHAKLLDVNQPPQMLNQNANSNAQREIEGRGVKREKKREKSCVLEIRELQKQVDGEIRREIMQGKLDIQPSSAANKRTNLSTINAKRDTNPPSQSQKQRRELGHEAIQAKKSSDELLSDSNINNGRRKSKSKDRSKNISQNIKKFMKKNGMPAQQLKSLEQTLELKKHQKIKENLKSLSQFAKQHHVRHQSYNFHPKKKQDLSSNAQLLVQNESGKALPIKKLKPHFQKKPASKKQSAERSGKREQDYRGAVISQVERTIFEDEREFTRRSLPHQGRKDQVDRSSSIEEHMRYDPNGDVSQEFYEDYRKLLSSISKHQKVRDSSSSYERSSSQKAKKARSKKPAQPQSQLQRELETSLLQEKRQREAYENKTLTIDNQSRFSSLKNDNVYVPSVVQEKGASLIPPQSDIATIDRHHHLDRTQKRSTDFEQQRHQPRFQEARRSSDSGKSPKLSDQKAKVKVLMDRYGHNLPRSQIGAHSADTKLLIKLHTAAITIQQNFRRHLQARGFYDLDAEEFEEEDEVNELNEQPQSQMYLDSEEEQESVRRGNYSGSLTQSRKYEYVDTTEKKRAPEDFRPQRELVAQTSPLRIKDKYKKQKEAVGYSQIQQRLNPQILSQHKGSKFYSEDSSDQEKVIVCSVITSGRADNDESLSNTQKYIPLRQKAQIPTGKQPRPFEEKKQVTASASQSASNQTTVIKNQPQQPIYQRLQLEQAPESSSLDQSQLSSSSNRKKLVPALDFGKLNTIPAQKEEQKQVHFNLQPQTYQEEDVKHDQQPESNRSLFERTAFQDFQQKMKGEFKVDNYPEMLQLKEEAIRFREAEEQKRLHKLVKAKQLSPRTYDRKVRDLETWVTKEKEEVKKSRKALEEQSSKSAQQMIAQTQKTQESVKKMLPNSEHSVHNQLHAHQKERTYDSLPSENTMNHPISHRLSTRREDSTRLLDMIDDYKQPSAEAEDPYGSQAPAQSLHAQLQQQLHQRDQERLQQELERKKEIEMLKEQVRQQEQREAEAEAQRRAEEEQEYQRKAKLEQDRLAREAEKKRILDAQAERDRLRKVQEEKDKLLQEQKLAQEKKRLEEQAEAERKRKAKEEEELKRKKKLEEEAAEKERQRLKQLADEQEKQRRLKEQKEEEQRKIREAQLKKDQEERERRVKAEEELRVRKEQERQQQEQERLRKLQEEAEEEERLRQKEQLQEQLLREFEEAQRKIVQEATQEDNQSGLSQEQNHAEQSEEEEEEPDFDPFMRDRERRLIDDALKGKDILDSFEDDKEQQQQHFQDLLNRISDEEDDRDEEQTLEVFLQSNQQSNALLRNPHSDLLRDDENRQLARTTSSQNLDHRSLEGYQNYQDLLEQAASEEDEQHKQSFFRQGNHPLLNSQGNYPSTSKLNDDSMDEDRLASQLLERQDRKEKQQSQALAEMVKQENYFSRDFDDQQPEDLLTSLQKSLDKGDKPDVKQLSSSKILFQDEAEEEKKEEQKVNEEWKIQEVHRNDRLTSTMRDQIPVEQEQTLPSGMPVSPASGEGHDIRITTGAQSLESTISDGEQIRNAITEANKAPPAEEEQKDEVGQLDRQVDQITEDIFRQLVSELRIDLDLLLLTDPRRLLKEEVSAASGAQSHFLSESGRFLVFERRGIKTDLFAIERYVEEVVEEILRERARFVQAISTPISKDAREVLNQLQNSEIGSYEHFEPHYPVVLPLDLYLRLERRRKEQREKELQEQVGRSGQNLTPQQLHDRNFLAECEHIHNKVLFDCINDALLQFKPFAKEGVPLPWSRNNRRLKPTEEFSIEEMFEIVKHDLFRWAIMQAGTLPRREFVFNNMFDDELFAEIREKKLATLLAREMIENEPKWLNYEFEEAQVKIDIGDMILEQLVTETIAILRQNEVSQSNSVSLSGSERVSASRPGAGRANSPIDPQDEGY